MVVSEVGRPPSEGKHSAREASRVTRTSTGLASTGAGGGGISTAGGAGAGSATAGALATTLAGAGSSRFDGRRWDGCFVPRLAAGAGTVEGGTGAEAAEAGAVVAGAVATGGTTAVVATRAATMAG